MTVIGKHARDLIQALLGQVGYRVLRTSQIGVDLPTDLVRVCGRNARVILDVGANEGQSAIELRRRFPKADIHSFEPYPPALAAARTALGRDRHVHFYDYALGDQEGIRTLYCNQGSQTNALLPNSPDLTPFAPAELFRPVGTLETRVRQLDGFCREQGIGAIDLLKIDTQGYELYVLRGAADLLQRRAITAIVLELLFAPYYEGQAYFEQVYSHLVAQGYRLVGLYYPTNSDDLSILCCIGLFRR